MAELNCRCLNVTVHLDSEVQFDSPVKPSDLLISAKKASEFELYEVKLGVAGITVVHNCLMQSYQSGDWIIHKCANCGTDTHITHCVKGDSKVFVTNKIETDAGKTEELRRSERFSRVFNIVLNDDTVDQHRAFTMSFSNNDPVMKQLHQQIKTFLSKEEAALEQRIMDFEKEQREAFSRLCNRVHKERGLIFRSLAKARTEEGTSEQEKGQADMEFIAKSGTSLVMGQRNQSLTSSNNSSNSSSPGRQPEVTIMLQDKPLGDKSHGMISKEDGFEDALFGMDGIDGDDHGTHFIQSDDDDESTSTDDSYREELTHSSHPVNVAQSLPITVPLYTTYSSRQQPSEHRDEKIHIAPSQMAESIKALALSVHQETEMFGDLPKPRTNSCTWAR